MPEQTQEAPKQEIDDRGVPLANKVKELERKLQERLDKEAQTAKELEELKAFKSKFDAEEDAQTARADPKEKLMNFVSDPDGYIERRINEREFQRQIPQAESWIKSQKGYSPDDDAQIFRVIKENKLDTPYHSPMERASTAWRLLNAERREREFQKQEEERQRGGQTLEGSGKTTPKQAPVTRQDVIRKLAEAEAKGDMDAAIKYTSLLEDIR